MNNNGETKYVGNERVKIEWHHHKGLKDIFCFFIYSIFNDISMNFAK